MAKFTGQLLSNEIFSSLYNMIISQQVFADNLAGVGSSLVDKARVDGGLFGDTKLYIATDALKSAPWLDDAEAENLLKLHRPKDPEVQAIHLDKFRQISLTVDNYLTKRAWSTADAFSQFNSVMKGWIRDTKRIYDASTYNVFIGTSRGVEGRQQITVPIAEGTTGLTGLEKAKMEAMIVADTLADLIVDLKDFSRDFNDYGYLRSYGDEEIKVIWNAKFHNKLRKVDMPTIFHKDGLIDKFDQETLPARFFGTILTTENLASFSSASGEAGKPIKTADGEYTGTDNGIVRAAVEKVVNNKHYFPGDQIAAGDTVGAGKDWKPGEVYIEQGDIIGKVLIKYPPYMSAFEVGTSFFNPKSLTENHYLTFGHNTLEYLKNYPFIELKEA